MNRPPTFWNQGRNTYRIVKWINGLKIQDEICYKDYRFWLLQQGCVVPGCKRDPNAHHVDKPGVAMKDIDFGGTIGICRWHHQGSEGIHTIGKLTWQLKVLNIDLAMEARNRLARFIREKRKSWEKDYAMNAWLNRRNHG